MDNTVGNFKPGLTFDDVLLKPGYAEFTRSEIDLSTHLTRGIKLNLPLVSSPMDTVTESKLAIELALAGGIGIIHRSLSIEKQAEEVKKVKTKKLIVGAAIGTLGNYKKRAARLVNAGADVILIDSAHGFSKFVLEATQNLKKEYPKLQIIAGNIATREGAEALIKVGADGLRVGMGPGSICSTRIISGMGVPQITAIMETAKVATKHKIPIIADGGIKYSGDVVKALAAGASTVMLGSMFAGTKESPGKVIELDPAHVPSRFQSILNGKTKKYRFKVYRGMGSLPAMKKGAAIQAEDEFHGKEYNKKYTLVAEGVQGYIPYRGKLSDVTDQIVGGVRSGFYYVGARSIEQLWQKKEFMQITQASLTESHPHDILVSDSGKNYG
jgi:IMP dehydrogenase